MALKIVKVYRKLSKQILSCCVKSDEWILLINSLSDNNIGGSVIKHVMEGLQHCSNLKYLK